MNTRGRMMDKRLRVGTRGSALALWQTDHVIRLLSEHDPTLQVERLIMSSPGDRAPDRPLSRIGDKGAFTRDLEGALSTGAIDAAVHSLKDLPTELPSELAIGAVLERADPREVLLSPDRYTLATLPAGAVVGTSSLRRRAQILAARSDVAVRDLRGNVTTRLLKVARGEYAAAVMAYAGLIRMGKANLVAEVFEPEVMLPAAGQGAIAVEIRRGDDRVADLVRPLEHRPTLLCTTAERALLARLEGGCQVPVAALGTLAGEVLTLSALVADPDGRDIVRARAAEVVRDGKEAAALGENLAERLMESGAAAILARVRATSTDTA